MLFVHGLGCSGGFWTDVVELFSDSYTCVVVDLEGFGASPPLTGPRTVAQWAAPLESVLEGFAGPAIVFGHSLGGMVSQELVLAAPGLVRGLVLCNTIPRATDHVRQINGALVEMVRAQGPAGLADAMAAGLFGPVKFDGTARAEAQFLHDCTSTDARSLEYGLKAIMAFDALGRLGQVGVPALVLTGEHEGNLPDQEVLVAALPDATLVSMAGTGHMAPAEDPAGFGVALGPFLDRLG